MVESTVVCEQSYFGFFLCADLDLLLMDEEPLGLQFSLVQSSSDDKDEKEFL